MPKAAPGITWGRLAVSESEQTMNYYEELRRAVLIHLGPNCSKDRCAELAFTHSHQEWADRYSDWLVKIAVLEDCFDGTQAPRDARTHMLSHPAQNLEALCAQRRAA